MLSLKSLILSELSCFNALMEENIVEKQPLEEIQVEEENTQIVDDEFLSLIEDRKIELISKLSQEEDFYALVEERKTALLNKLSFEEEPNLLLEEETSNLLEEETSNLLEEPAIENLIVEEPKINYTEQWLYHPSYDRYEKIILEFCRNLTTYTGFRIKPDDHYDKVADFLLWMVDTDCLKSEILKGKEPNLGAIWHFFTHWVIRTSFKQGQDVLTRELDGARTQAETQKKTLGLKEKVFEAPVLARQVKDSEGDVLDMYSEDQEDPSLLLREEFLNDRVLKFLKIKFPNDYGFYHQLFLDKLHETYPDVISWSASLNLNERQLIHHITLMNKKLRSFGRDAFIS